MVFVFKFKKNICMHTVDPCLHQLYISKLSMHTLQSDFLEVHGTRNLHFGIRALVNSVLALHIKSWSDKDKHILELYV